MLWSKVPLFRPLARMVCPTMEMFHVYKKTLESIWREPVFFFPFIAPLKHAFYPDSKVKQKPHLKGIEIVFTACTLAYPDIRDRLLHLQEGIEGVLKTHVRNLIMFFEFFLPVVLSQSLSLCFSCLCSWALFDHCVVCFFLCVFMGLWGFVD